MQKKEKVFYYSSTVEDGKVTTHEGDPAHAVYLSDIETIQKRSARWHKWVEKNVPGAYDDMGILDPEVMAKYSDICDQFMNGKKLK